MVRSLGGMMKNNMGLWAGARIGMTLAACVTAVSGRANAQLLSSARPDIVGTFAPNTGMVVISVDGDTSTAQVASGFIALSTPDATCVPASGNGCVYTLASLQVLVNPFPIKGVTIPDFRIDNWAPVYNVTDHDGSGFVVPPSTPFLGSFTEGGAPVAVTLSHDPTPLTVIVDTAHNRLVITGDFSGTIDGSAVEATVMVSAQQPLKNLPPIANAGPAMHLFTALDGLATIPFDASRTTDPNGDLSWTYFQDLQSGFRYPSGSAALRERFGDYKFRLVAGDAQGGEDTASLDVHVSCVIPPVITTAGLRATQTCSSSATQVAIAAPAVSTVCSPGQFQLTGQVVALGSMSLGTPIPIVNGSANLAPGPITVRWTAVDLAGNSASVDQPFDVIEPPGLIATRSLNVAPGVSISNETGGFATLVNTGTLSTELGASSQVGSILSRASVMLDSHSYVNGFVRTAGGITAQDSVTVTGGEFMHGAVSFLPLPSFSAGLSAGTQPVSLEPGASVTEAPGAFGDVTVKSGATLTLSSGTYAFRSLDIEPSATVVLNGTSAVNISVAGSAILRGVFTGQNVESRLTVLDLGTGTVSVDAVFLGTLAVPNGQLSFSTIQGSDRGSFFAQDVLVQANQTLFVHPFGCP